jgi:uncharacterized protein YbaP (TraB family)
MKIRAAFLFLMIYLSGPRCLRADQALLWKISGGDLSAPSYLFGTIHISAAEVFNLPEGCLQALDSTAILALELDPSALADPRLATKIMMKEGSLKKLLTAEDYQLLDSLMLNSMGLPLSMFDQVQPFFVAAMMELNQFSKDTSLPLDLWLGQQAQIRNKELVGLETADEQLEAIAVLDYREQAAYLSEALHEAEDSAGLERMLKFYISGQLDSLLLPEFTESMPPQLRKAMIDDRNRRMAARLESMIKKHRVFAAVGALHLPGKNGIIALLREKGYRLEPYKP